MERDFVQRGDASRERIRTLTARLTDEQLTLQVDPDWTVSALLAHIAFWDRFVVAEWEHALREGLPAPIRWERPNTDLVNAANADEWRAIPPTTAVELIHAATEQHDAYVAALDERYASEAIAQGRPNLLDRSRHRDEHLDAIERTIGPV